MGEKVTLHIVCEVCGKALQVETLEFFDGDVCAIVAKLCPVCTQRHTDVGYGEGYSAGVEACS